VFILSVCHRPLWTGGHTPLSTFPSVSLPPPTPAITPSAMPTALCSLIQHTAIYNLKSEIERLPLPPFLYFFFLSTFGLPDADPTFHHSITPLFPPGCRPYGPEANWGKPLTCNLGTPGPDRIHSVSIF
jgi:hypothetical protein